MLMSFICYSLILWYRSIKFSIKFQLFWLFFFFISNPLYPKKHLDILCILYYVLNSNGVKTASCEKFLEKIFYVKDIVKIFLLNIPSLFIVKKIIYKFKKEKKAEIYGIYRYFVKNVYTVSFFVICKHRNNYKVKGLSWFFIFLLHIIDFSFDLYVIFE